MSVEPGGPDSLRLMDVPVPTPGPSQILIAVKACGVNFPDVLTIDDKYQVKTPRPFAPGAEVAGIVAAIGQEVTNFAVGDHVTARTGTGGMAEFLVANADRCQPLAGDVAFTDAAVMQFTFETAYYALVTRAKLRAGETILVLGAAGGVGSATIQVARNLGARVIAAVSSEDKAAFATSLGAAATFVYPPSPADDKRSLVARLGETIGKAGADVVVDPVGGWLSEIGLRSIAEGGRFLVLGFTAGIASLPLNLPLLKNCDVLGINWRTFVLQNGGESAANQDVLRQWHRQGELTAGITAEYPLEDGAKALRLVADRKAIGKVVVRIA